MLRENRSELQEATPGSAIFSSWAFPEHLEDLGKDSTGRGLLLAFEKSAALSPHCLKKEGACVQRTQRCNTFVRLDALPL